MAANVRNKTHVPYCPLDVTQKTYFSTRIMSTVLDNPQEQSARSKLNSKLKVKSETYIEFILLVI